MHIHILYVILCTYNMCVCVYIYIYIYILQIKVALYILSYPWDNKITPSSLASMFRWRHCRTRRRGWGPGHSEILLWSLELLLVGHVIWLFPSTIESSIKVKGKVLIYICVGHMITYIYEQQKKLWIYEYIYITYFEDLFRSSSCVRHDELAKIVSAVVSPCSCLRTYFYEKKDPVNWKRVWC